MKVTRQQDYLTAALVRMATHGQRPRCGDPATHAYWTSEEQVEREQAVSWCAGCPILRECAAAAESESFGVWGAVDVTPLTTRQKRVQALKAAGVTPRSSDPETSTNHNPQPKENSHVPVQL